MKPLFLLPLLFLAGCSTIKPERIPGAPVVAACGVAVYPVSVVMAADCALQGDKDAAKVFLTMPYWITKMYLEGE